MLLFLRVQAIVSAMPKQKPELLKKDKQKEAAVGQPLVYIRKILLHRQFDQFADMDLYRIKAFDRTIIRIKQEREFRAS